MSLKFKWRKNKTTSGKHSDVGAKKDQLEGANKDLSVKSASITDLNQKLEQLVVSRTEALQSAMHDLDTFFIAPRMILGAH